LTTPDMSQFAKYIPGFEFLSNLTRQAAGGAVPGAQSGVPGMPPMSHWVAPTFDVEELDKRIQDLRAVHFWLDQNTKALAATIQALEVQKMTLATLKGMNVSMHEMADAFKIRPETFQTGASAFASAPAPASSPAPSPAAAPEPSAQDDSTDDEAPARPTVDPMQWWNALTEQFQTIASGAIKDITEQTSKAAEQMAQTVQSVQASAEAAVAPVAAAAQKVRESASPSAGKAAGKARAPAKKAKPAAKASAQAGKPASAAGRAQPAAKKSAATKPTAPRSATARRATKG
jgi:hypothetical protein